MTLSCNLLYSYVYCPLYAFIFRFEQCFLFSFVCRTFEMLSDYCDEYSNLIPLGFVLGFYVSIVVGRWWDQFLQIPWPNRMAMFVTANLHGQDERGRLMRRTVMRYLCLSFVITMSSISPTVKKRFPTFAHMEEAGTIIMELCFADDSLHFKTVLI